LDNLVISKLYKEDVLSTYNYIKNVLNAPMAAKNLKNEVKEKLIYISKNPTHRPLVYDKYLASLGYRLISVKNYLIFYIIEPQPSRKSGEGSPLDDIHIKIVRFLYCKRDWINILKEKTIEEMM
jgi:plasmid stabilization system protein ParE